MRFPCGLVYLISDKAHVHRLYIATDTAPSHYGAAVHITPHRASRLLASLFITAYTYRWAGLFSTDTAVTV